MLVMGLADCIKHPWQVIRIVQMAYATAVCAAEATNRHEPLSNACGDLALQIQCCSGDECLQKARVGQKIIDMPSPGFLLAQKNLDMPVHPLQSARTSRRAGVAVVTRSKFKDAQGGDLNFQRSAHVKDERVNSRAIALRRHLGLQ